jgi:hypothetical protein
LFANRYTAFIDACAMVGVLKRNMLLSLTEEGFLRRYINPRRSLTWPRCRAYTNVAIDYNKALGYL